MTSQATQFCEHCGNPMIANAKFCEKCGKPATAQSAAPVVDSASAGLASIIMPVSSAPPVMPEPAVAQPAIAQTVHESTPAAQSQLENYTLLKQIYNQAAQVDPLQRDSFLVGACEGNSALLQELRSMFVTEVGSLTGQPQQQVPESGTGIAGTSQAYMIGVYRPLRELGRGGMGVVYLAVRDDGAFRKNVALKLLLRECVSAEFVQRFKQERQVLAALDHPNIARILDGGDTYDGMPYYVMEYVEGLPLDKYCDQQRLSLNGRIKIFQQVCLAVDYLHQNSILHRDLKPSNILVSSDGVVKLLDFGIAKVVGAGAWANPDLTTAQGRPMTPTYASPEQISGGTMAKTSDIYSLGAILYTLLTGRSAYNDLDDKLAKIADRALPTKPSLNIREDLRSAETTAQFRRAMMGELDSIVLMAMQIEPRNRYQSAADLAQDLQRFLDGSPVSAYHTSAAGRSVKLLKRKSTAVAVVCGFLVLTGIGVWEWTRLEHQKAEATSNYARLNGLIDQLQNRVNKLSTTPTGSAQQQTPTDVPIDKDVQQFKAAFQKDFANAPDHDALLAKGIKYLDSVRSVAPANPNLNVEVGDAYRQLGDLQQAGVKSSKAALTTYQKAATTLATVAGTEKAKQHLAVVNARIQALGGTAVVIPTEQPPVQQVVETPAENQVAQNIPLLKPPRVVPVQHQQQDSTTPPPPPVAEKPAISPETEDALISATSKVQIADQTLEPLRRNLERDGQTLNADTLARIGRMHASLDRARRAVAAGNEAEAKESITAADALATKLLSSVGR